jgi:hypothetical protein
VALEVLSWPFQPIQNGRSGSGLGGEPKFRHLFVDEWNKGKNKCLYYSLNYVSCRPGHLKIRAKSLAAIECGLADDSLGVFEPPANSVRTGLKRRQSLEIGCLREQSLATIECGLIDDSLGGFEPPANSI